MVEDLYLLSLSFLHIGAPKTWYAVPAQYADAFEKVVQDKVCFSQVCISWLYRSLMNSSSPLVLTLLDA